MTLPTSRLYTQGTAAPIQAALINLLQDCVLGAKVSSRYKWQTPSRPNVDGVGNTYAADGLTYAASGTFAGMMIADTLEGDRITGFAVKHLGTASGATVNYTLNLNKGDGSPTILATISAASVSGVYSLFTATLATPHVMASAESLYLSETTAMPVSHRLVMIGTQYDRL